MNANAARITPPVQARPLRPLAEALLALKNPAEIEAFLRDLCTPGEIKDFNERWQIAQLLAGGALSYREIAEQAGASITTVTRVARFLKDEPYQGYKLALDRLSPQKERH
jgi:TrpR-related protein YerC/YecD